MHRACLRSTQHSNFLRRYGYVDASQKVMALFTERNWMPVIADELVNRLLGAVCLTVSLLAGVLCAVVALLVHNDVTFSIVAGL